MKREFDFDNLGKMTPYQVPEGFFEEMQKNVLERTEKSVVKKSIWLRFVPVISAVAAILAAVIYIPVHMNHINEEPISQASVVDDTWLENISDEDLELMNDFANYDVFMNE